MSRPKIQIPDKIARHVASARTLMRRRRARADERLTTASALDRVLGGLPRGETTELIGRGSSGRTSLVLALLASITGRGEPAALVDRTDSLDPTLARAIGIDLPQLLWVRTRTMRETLSSAEIVLGTGMPLVVVDLGMPPLTGGRGSEASWLRLARAAKKARTALVVAAPYRASGTAATTILEMRAEGRWRRAASMHAPALLDGLDSRIAPNKAYTGKARAGMASGTAAVAAATVARWTVTDAVVDPDTVIAHAARMQERDIGRDKRHAVA